MSPNEWIVPIALLLMLAPFAAQSRGKVRDAIQDKIIEDEDTSEGVEEITSLSSSASSLHGENWLAPVRAS